MMLDMVNHRFVYIHFTIYFYLQWVSDIVIPDINEKRIVLFFVLCGDYLELKLTSKPHFS